MRGLFPKYMSMHIIVSVFNSISVIYVHAEARLATSDSDRWLALLDLWYASHRLLSHSEKSPARPMLCYTTNYWQQFWVQFVV